jgi:hypothetical protein
MRPMSKHARVAVAATAGAWWLLALAACGGAKPAESPGTCPEGTVLTGDSCLPESSGEAKATGDAKPNGEADPATASTKPPAAPSASPPGSGDAEVSGGSYDKDAVEAQLKRAAKQVRFNCGAASDEDGAKKGPWGATTATIVLGRNGHVHEVTVPPPYSGKPVGDCVVNSFRKIQYPPYNAVSDTSITWDVQILEPKN